MSNRPKTLAWAELADGTEFEDVRVTLATKVQYERTARANKWDHEAMPFTTSAFFAWHAARLAGALPADMTFDQFMSQVIDAGVENETPDDTEGEDLDDPDRPTDPASFTISP